MGGLVSQVASSIKAINTQQQQQPAVQQPQQTVQVPGIIGQALPFATAVESSPSTVPQTPLTTVQPQEPVSLNSPLKVTQPATVASTLSSIGSTNNTPQQTVNASNNTDMLIQQLIEALSKYNNSQGIYNIPLGQVKQQQQVNPYTINPYSFGYNDKSLLSGLYSNNTWF